MTELEAQTATSPNTPMVHSRWSLVGKVALAVAGLALLLFLGRQLGAYVPQFAAWVDTLGFWGPLVFILGYAAATVGFIPGLILTMAAGISTCWRWIMKASLTRGFQILISS